MRERKKLRSNKISFMFVRKIRICSCRYTLTRIHFALCNWHTQLHTVNQRTLALLLVDLYIVNANLRIDPALPALSSQVRLSSSPALPRIILLRLVTLCTCRFTLVVCVNIWKDISWRGVSACMPQLHERHRSKHDYDGWRCETYVAQMQALNASHPPDEEGCCVSRFLCLAFTFDQDKSFLYIK